MLVFKTFAEDDKKAPAPGFEPRVPFGDGSREHHSQDIIVSSDVSRPLPYQIRLRWHK